LERYLRGFLSEMVRLLLEGKGGEVGELFREYLRRLEEKDLDISWLAKTERLTESPETYRQKVAGGRRNAGAAYELALASGRDYRAGDQISYYVTGKGRKVRVFENCKPIAAYDPLHPDANVLYYQGKLMELVEKFQKFLPHMDSSGKRKAQRKPSAS
jgi:DNA polymerase, archaea type